MKDERLRKIQEIEQASFEAYCKRLGATPSEVEAQLLPPTRIAVEQRFRVSQKMFGASKRNTLEAKITELLNGRYVPLNRALVDLERLSYIDMVVSATGNLPINYRYLSGLARDLGLPRPRSADPELLKAFLLEIPSLNLYESHFNAFLAGETTIDRLPAVAVFPFLYGSFQELVDILMPVTGLIGKSLTPAEILEKAKQPEFVEVCISCLEVIDCDAAYSAGLDEIPHLSTVRDDGVIYLDLITGGGWSFVWLHELGHLMMGHLARGSSHDVEFEADSFAISCLAHDLSRIRVEAASWAYVGVILLFLVFHILDIKRGGRESPSHPRAGRRLKRFLSTHEVKWHIASSIMHALEPAVRSRWELGSTWNLDSI